ncbi:hypothetical protein H2202_010846 [Exophiala xenobiotica]|nr:hypothetical protein H2202_010846 [Exophiala xenobiotica]KAK5215738.1 hypothetical protein LTR72_011225 [Exophiala xenobiotica]KAK5220256.1 hypothetical protein LTR47_011311 [Exophiala xenobiotica]KAK5244420.1 hypothetical protein LTS06_009999 [Exophiala xenobiotica]KAK5282448.1 hypothetical protein LTR40_003293 [Exophiala xenobiotica]
MADRDRDYVHGAPATDAVNREDGNSYHLGPQEDSATALEKVRTAGSISISPELFEKLYLSPKNAVKGDIRRTFGNPTPIALGGFLLSLSPLSNVLLGWRGSGGLGAAEVGVYFFCGGLLMILGAIFEFVLGNTFPSVVFGTFGAYWLAYAATLTPYFNATAAYQPNSPTTASTNPEFAASFAFFLLYMGLLCLIYLVCALRTNVVFVLIFAGLVPAFSCLAASFWHLAQDNASTATTLQHAGAGLAFAVCLLGWYLFTVQLLAAVDFPINLPVGDLSHIIKGASEKAKRKAPNRDAS